MPFSLAKILRQVAFVLFVNYILAWVILASYEKPEKENERWMPVLRFASPKGLMWDRGTFSLKFLR